ncbi:MAG: hypothetical protein JXA25_13935 [Anaerolineales bacterium]|nr:hypothetical protein [Anaerolineales bacterium]
MDKQKTSGRWLQEYRVRKNLVRLYTALTILTMLSLVGSAGWALYAWYFSYVHYGPAAIWNWIKNPLLLSALLLPLLLLFLAQWNRLSQIRVRTHTRGLQILRGQKKINIPWDAVQEIYTTATQYGINGFIWKKKAGIRLATNTARREVTLEADLAEFENLVQTVKSSIYPRIGIAVDKLLASDQPIDFGPLQVSTRSVSVSGSSIPWEDVNTCTLNNGRLHLTYLQKDRERTIRLRSARVPNLDLCYEILKKMSGA